MMDYALISSLSKFRLLGEIGTAEDFADKLNYRYTSAFLLMCVVLCSLKQFVFKAIQCWVPKEWPGAWEQYAENYCWVQDTYFVDGDMKSTFPRDNRHNLEIGYYQWVPFLLVCQAACFYTPHIMWRFVGRVTGYDVNALIGYAMTANVLDVAKKEKVMKHVAQQIVKAMRHRKQAQKLQGIKRFIPCFWIGKKSGNFLIAQYIFKKVLYIVNALCQFWFMRDYLGFKSFFFGYDILKTLVQGGTWANNAMFPRVTFCDVPIRAVGQYYNRTIQCVLPMNMINEKLYIFLWFWILVCLVSMVISIIHWLSTLVIRTRKSFLDRYVKHLKEKDATKKETDQFVNHFLEKDGLFILKMIQRNCGDVIATDILERTYDAWKEWQKTEDTEKQKTDSFGRDIDTEKPTSL